MATNIDYEAKIERLENECSIMRDSNNKLTEELIETKQALKYLQSKIADFAVEHAANELPLN